MRFAGALAALPMVAALAGGTGPAAAGPLAPYHDPPFTCAVIDYGTSPPSLPAPEHDPLCVRYDKTNITVSNLGAVDFLAAEPGRVAIVAGKCAYWQQDHWVVRAAPGTTPLVEWQGSYWYDATTGTAAGIVRGFRVNGEPADGRRFVEAVRPLVGDAVADQLAPFAADGGGGGSSFALPAAFGAGVCTRPAAPPTEPGNGAPPPAVREAVESPGAQQPPAGELAATGGGAHAMMALLVVAAAAALWRARSAPG